MEGANAWVPALATVVTALVAGAAAWFNGRDPYRRIRDALDIHERLSEADVADATRQRWQLHLEDLLSQPPARFQRPWVFPIYGVIVLAQVFQVAGFFYGGSFGQFGMFLIWSAGIVGLMLWAVTGQRARLRLPWSRKRRERS